MTLYLQQYFDALTFILKARGVLKKYQQGESSLPLPISGCHQHCHHFNVFNQLWQLSLFSSIYFQPSPSGFNLFIFFSEKCHLSVRDPAGRRWFIQIASMKRVFNKATLFKSVGKVKGSQQGMVKQLLPSKSKYL